MISFLTLLSADVSFSAVKTLAALCLVQAVNLAIGVETVSHARVVLNVLKDTTYLAAVLGRRSCLYLS